MSDLLEIAIREIDSIVILDLAGKLIAGEPCNSFRSAIHEQQTAQHLRIIINLEKVDFIDSTGLGALVLCFTTLQKAGGALKLLHVNKRNIELLVLTKLSTIFETFQEEQDAVNSFFPERKIERFDILQFVKNTREQE
ncbi:MAG TPA: STAS domain-containing protein [Bryobacteraceae bacterium]|nr:STAS domain-containing protein [Bryobacteraceae bacterium]